MRKMTETSPHYTGKSTLICSGHFSKGCADEGQAGDAMSLAGQPWGTLFSLGQHTPSLLPEETPGSQALQWLRFLPCTALGSTAVRVWRSFQVAKGPGAKGKESISTDCGSLALHMQVPLLQSGGPTVASSSCPDAGCTTRTPGRWWVPSTCCCSC